jgi:hypothetical protein
MRSDTFVTVAHRAPALSRLRSGMPVACAVPTLLLATVVIRLWHFDGLYGQDPYAYFDYGATVLPRAILHGAPLTPMFWPLGYPVLVALAAMVLGAVPSAGQIVSLTSAMVMVGVTFVLGRELFADARVPPRIATWSAGIAAVLCGVCGWTLQGAVMVAPDGLSAALVMVSALGLYRWTKAGAVSSLPLIVSAAALAWAAVTRWEILVLLVLWIGAVASTVRVRRGQVRRHAAPALAVIVAVIGAQLVLAWLVPTSPWFHGRSFVGDSGLISGGGWSAMHAVQSTFANADGTQHYTLPNALYYAIAPFLAKDLTPLSVPFVLVGLWRLAQLNWRVLVALVAPPVLLLASVAGLSEQDLRFVLPALPFIALLAGFGAATLLGAISAGARTVVWCGVAAWLLVVASVGLLDMHKVVAASASDRAVAAWAATRVPSSGTLYTFEITETVAHSTRLRPVDLSLISRRALLARVRTHRSFLLLRVASMRGQWRNRLPAVNFRALHGDSLVVLGHMNAYTLYRVAGL